MHELQIRQFITKLNRYIFHIHLAYVTPLININFIIEYTQQVWYNGIGI